MKGTETPVLVMDETPNQYKDRVRDDISRARIIIGLLSPHNEAGRFSQSIAFLRADIKELLRELITVERWRLKEGIERTEPYLPKTLREQPRNTRKEP